MSARIEHPEDELKWFTGSAQHSKGWRMALTDVEVNQERKTLNPVTNLTWFEVPITETDVRKN